MSLYRLKIDPAKAYDIDTEHLDVVLDSGTIIARVETVRVLETYARLLDSLVNGDRVQAQIDQDLLENGKSGWQICYGSSLHQF